MRSPRSASGLLVEPEHLGEVERIGPVRQSLFELPVDAEPFQRGALPAHRGTDPVVAGAAGLGGGIDQQMEVRGVRPPAAPALQPVQQQVPREIVERADAPAMVSRSLPRSTSSSMRLAIWATRAAWTAARARMSRVAIAGRLQGRVGPVAVLVIDRAAVLAHAVRSAGVAKPVIHVAVFSPAPRCGRRRYAGGRMRP